MIHTDLVGSTAGTRSDLPLIEGPPYRRQSEPRWFCPDSPCSWLWTLPPVDREDPMRHWCPPWGRTMEYRWISLSLSLPPSFCLSSHQQNLNFLFRARVAVTSRWMAPFWSALLCEKHTQNIVIHTVLISQWRVEHSVCVCVCVCAAHKCLWKSKVMWVMFGLSSARTCFIKASPNTWHR